jgi:hypothetical protein
LGKVKSRQESPHVRDVFLGFQIQERDGIFIAVPLEWARGRGETIAATDMATLLEEIRRWWYHVTA